MACIMKGAFAAPVRGSARSLRQYMREQRLAAGQHVVVGRVKIARIPRVCDAVRMLGEIEQQRYLVVGVGLDDAHNVAVVYAASARLFCRCTTCRAPTACAAQADRPDCRAPRGSWRRRRSKIPFPSPVRAPAFSSQIPPSDCGKYCRGTQRVFLSQQRLLSFSKFYHKNFSHASHSFGKTAHAINKSSKNPPKNFTQLFCLSLEKQAAIW